MKKRFILSVVFALCSMIGFAQQPEDNSSMVYFTQEITPEALVNIYKALGVEATMLHLSSRELNVSMARILLTMPKRLDWDPALIK